MDLVITEKEKRISIKLVVICGLIVGAVYASEVYVEKFTSGQSVENVALKKEQTEFRKRLAEIQDEEKLQNQYVESYLSYQNSGLIIGEIQDADVDVIARVAEESRLTLLERIQQIQSDRKLYKVETILTTAENLPSSFSEYTVESNVAVRTNKMIIRMEMLHSLDILILINDFYDVENNHFFPVECSITRRGKIEKVTAEQLLEASPKLFGECSLVWLTVYDPEQGKAQEAAGV